MSNNIGDSVFTKKLTCSSSNQELDLLTTRNQVILVSDGDCFVNFDKDVTTAGRFLIKANTPVSFDNIMVRQLNYLADSATPALYIMAYKTK
jgi:hypothetical protein